MRKRDNGWAVVNHLLRDMKKDNLYRVENVGMNLFFNFSITMFTPCRADHFHILMILDGIITSTE